MALAIEVYRGAGDRPGDDIRDDLLGDSLEAALARGRGELDAHAHATIATVLSLCVPRADLCLGDIVAIDDPTQGADWKGKIVGIRHSLAFGDPPTTLTVERLRDV